MKTHHFVLSFVAMLSLAVAVVWPGPAQSQGDPGFYLPLVRKGGEATLTPTPKPTGTSTPTPTSTPTSTPTVTPTVCAAPGIEFTYVPPYNSFENLRGRATCVAPAEYRVAAYIYVAGGWWTKPTFADPLTAIQGDGSFVVDITTGGIDQQATRIAAFLVPAGYAPPAMSGGAVLPAELYDDAVAHTLAEREAVYRTVEFSGRTWRVKASETRAGPGPNYFSDRPEDVWVDEDGRLHMRIAYHDGRWYATEVICEQSFGHGIYTFVLNSSVEMDANIVWGLFTWDEQAAEQHYREIDIEFSHWGDVQTENAQYVVQPWDTPGNLHKFDVASVDETSTHSFEWREDTIHFRSLDQNGEEIESYNYTGGDVPPAGEENPRINLWLLNGTPPLNGNEIEVIIEQFEFAPLEELTPTPTPTGTSTPTPTGTSTPTPTSTATSTPTVTPTVCAAPGIEFTYVPPYNSFENLRGRATCVAPAEYRVAAYIYVAGGWWTKPTFADPLTAIQGDGSFVVDITTGGIDQQATRIAAFLVPAGYAPPAMSGGAVLPAELYDDAVAHTLAEREPTSVASYRTGDQPIVGN